MTQRRPGGRWACPRRETPARLQGRYRSRPLRRVQQCLRAQDRLRGCNACPVLDRRSDDVERFPRASGRGHNVDVVKEGGQAFTRLQAPVGSNEGIVLAKRVQGWGQGVALLAAFALTDAPDASHQ